MMKYSIHVVLTSHPIVIKRWKRKARSITKIVLTEMELVLHFKGSQLSTGWGLTYFRSQWEKFSNYTSLLSPLFALPYLGDLGIQLKRIKSECENF